MMWLFDTSDFVARAQCGNWSEWLLVANQMGNAMIAAAYFAIPAELFYFYQRRRSLLPNGWIILCFVAFILLCGMTHVLGVAVFYWPPYRFITLVDFLTAVASVPTAALLPGVVRKLMKLTTPTEYQAVIRQLEEAREKERIMLEELEKHNLALRQQIHDMRDTMATLAYQKGLFQEMALLQEHLKKIREAGLVSTIG